MLPPTTTRRMLETVNRYNFADGMRINATKNKGKSLLYIFNCLQTVAVCYECYFKPHEIWPKGLGCCFFSIMDFHKDICPVIYLLDFHHL